MAQLNMNGKSVLITGGVSALGAGCVKELLNAGATQIAVLDITEDVGKAYVEELNKTYPGSVIFVKCDVGNEESIAASFDQVITKFKTLDAVFNVAGIMNEAAYIWLKMCEVNFIDNLFEKTGVRILTICPGPTDTPLMHDLERKGRDSKTGDKLECLLQSVVLQTKETVVAAILKICEEGSNGSIWWPTDNKPAKDITPVIRAAFKSFQDALFN